MADVPGKFYKATKVRTGVSPSSPGAIEGEVLPPLNPPGGGLNSVGLTMPSAFNVANSPLTANGSLDVTGAGTTAQYIRGDGSLASFPSLTGFVPYTGATANVELGEYGVEAGFVTLDTSPTNTPTEQGTIFWDADDETVDVVLNGYTMKIGEDLFYPVKNQTGSTIAKGTAVRFNGTLGASGRLLIAPFIADGSVPSSRFMGVTAEEILNGEDGKVLYFGRVRGINTNAFNQGDILYASTTVAGGFQTAIPLPPNNIVQIAAVVNKSINQGTIFVRPTLGSNINTDEGVKIISGTTGDLLQLQSNGLWENKTKAQVLGGTSGQFVKGDGSLDSTTYQSTADKGQPNGYASLDSNGKVPLTQINDALIGNVNFQGLWNASTNSPTLANPPAAGTKGYYYIVSTGGTFAGISFEVGDWIISNGSAWDKVDNTDAVSSVFGRTGNVVAANGDYNTSQVTESTNLYFTQARVSANTDVAANTAARHAAVTLGTANGLSLSTQQLSLGLASAGVTGALSGTDWSTFNSKQNALNGTGFVKISGTTISYDNSTYYLASNPSGFISANQTITLSGDATGSGATAITVTLANSGVTAGTYNNVATQVRPFTVDAKGRVTSIGTAVTITPAFSDVTGKPTTLAGYGITDAYTQTQVNTLLAGYLPLSGGTMTGVITTPNGTFGIIVGDDSRLADRNIANTLFVEGVQNNDRGYINFSQTTGNALGAINGGDLTWRGSTVWTSANITPVTSVTASSPLFSSGGTTPNITIQQASGSQSGFLSSTDWTTFNNKQNALTNPVTGTGANGRVAFWNGTTTQTSDADLFWDNTNKRLGIGVAAPTQKLDIVGNSAAVKISESGGAEVRMVAGGSSGFFGTYSNHSLQFLTNSGTKATLDPSGNLGLGVTPSAWVSPFTVFQLGTYGQYIAGQTNTADMKIGTNNYYNAGTYNYTTSGLAAARYDVGKDGFFWNIAPAGTANAAITFTQAMTLNASGNLLVGTTSDNGARLQVSGGVTSTGTTTNTIGFVSINTTASKTHRAYTDISGNYIIYDATLDSNRLTIASTGAATFSSSVTAGGGGTVKPQFIANGGPSLGAGMSFNTGLSGSGRRNWFVGTEENIEGDFVIKSSTAAGGNAQSGDTRIAILNNGNVGIGTNSPNQLLHVNGTSQLIGSNYGIAGNSDFSNYAIKGSSDGGTLIYNWYAGHIFQTNGGSEKMRITLGGNVGIGTNSPNVNGLSTALTINGSSTSGLEINANSVNQGYLIASTTLMVLNARTNIPLLFYTNDTERMRITSGGNVLIGTTTDNGSKLRVNGNVWVDGNVLMDNSVGRYVGFGTGTENPYLLFAQNGSILFNVETNDTYTFRRGGSSFVTFTGSGIETLAGGIRTVAPTGTNNEFWRLGRALLATSADPEDRWIRVQLGNRIYDILAIDRGNA